MTTVVLMTVLVLVLLSNYLQVKDRTADRKAMLAREKRLDAELSRLHQILDDMTTAKPEI